MIPNQWFNFLLHWGVYDGNFKSRKKIPAGEYPARFTKLLTGFKTAFGRTEIMPLIASLIGNLPDAGEKIARFTVAYDTLGRNHD